MTDPTRLVSLGPNQQSEFFAGTDITSPPVEIEDHKNTVSHESADVVEQLTLSELVEAQNKKYAQKNERRPSKKAKTSLRSLLQSSGQQNDIASSGSDIENENHSCEDEELVMKDENESTNKPNGEMDLNQNSKRGEMHPYRQIDAQEQIQKAHNADLASIQDPIKGKYSSIEDGEVREEDEDCEEYGEGGINLREQQIDCGVVQRNSLQNIIDMNAEVDLCYGQSISKNVY